MRKRAVFAAGLAMWMFMAVSSTALADLVNTALVSYLNVSGQTVQGLSNTVTVIVTPGSPPPPPPPPSGGLGTPTLNLPQFLPINSQITAGYSGDLAAYFSWTFTQLGTVPSSSRGLSPAVGAPAANFNTPSPVANLATAGLDLGTYLVTVTAHDASGGVSASASANVTLVSANLDHIHVFPNPWRMDRHSARPITFGNLTVDTEIRIFTVSGQHVKTLPMSSNRVEWDLTSDQGDKVASGIYMYLLKTDDGSKKTGKVVIIK